MNYIVLDMEWNQPSERKQMITEPVMLYGEIVQIGAVKLDENCRILETFKTMVAPEYYKEMNKIVSELTGITTKHLQHGFSFPYALNNFRTWCGTDFVFITWGGCDIDILRDNIKLYALDTKWIPDTYDLQLIFDYQITKENRPVSLLGAMEKIGEVPLSAHDALNDAINTACVCQHIDLAKGIAEYRDFPKQKKVKIKEHNKTENSVSNGNYPSKKSIFRNHSITHFCCPFCGGNVNCTDFIPQTTSKNISKYISLCKCDNGDELFVRVRITRRKNGKYDAKPLVYEVNDENRALYSKMKTKSEQYGYKNKKKANTH